MKRTSAMLSLVAAIGLFGPAPAWSELPCPPDLTCSGEVDVFDLMTLLNDWGASDTASDLNGDGVVDVFDLLILLGAWGPCVFDFGPGVDDPEAHLLVLDWLGPDGPIVAPPELVERASSDMAAIRKVEPATAGIVNSPPWHPYSILMVLPAGETPETASPELACLNTYYGVTGSTLLYDGSKSVHQLFFSEVANMPALAAIYDEAPGVINASSNHGLFVFGSWSFTVGEDDVWHWEVRHGWQDCMSVCICWGVFTFETTADGEVIPLGCELQSPAPHLCDPALACPSS